MYSKCPIQGWLRRPIPFTSANVNRLTVNHILHKCNSMTLCGKYWTPHMFRPKVTSCIKPPPSKKRERTENKTHTKKRRFNDKSPSSPCWHESKVQDQPSCGLSPWTRITNFKRDRFPLKPTRRTSKHSLANGQPPPNWCFKLAVEWLGVASH